MPEVIITYKNAKTLEALKDFAKYFDFSISTPKKKSPSKKEGDRIYFVNGVPIKKGDDSIDMTGLKQVFTGKNIDAKELRKKAWQRKK